MMISTANRRTLVPEALQTQLSVGANSACGQHAADGVNHAIKWKIDLLCCHRDNIVCQSDHQRKLYEGILTCSCGNKGWHQFLLCTHCIIKPFFHLSNSQRLDCFSKRVWVIVQTPDTVHRHFHITDYHYGCWMKQINILTHCCHLVSHHVESWTSSAGKRPTTIFKHKSATFR